MNDGQSARIAALLARMRLDGASPLGGLSLADVQAAARQVGRDVILCSSPEGTVAAWSWPAGCDPVASNTAPRLGRRALSPTVTMTLLIAYALAVETAGHEDGTAYVSRARVIAASRVLIGEHAGPIWSAAALDRELRHEHLVIPVGGDHVTLGPAVAGMDAQTRHALDSAASLLRASPLWGAIDDEVELTPTHMAAPLRLDDDHDIGAV